MLTVIWRRSPGTRATAIAQAWVRLLYTRTSPESNGSVRASRPPQPAPAGCIPGAVRAGCAACVAWAGYAACAAYADGAANRPPAQSHSAAANTPSGAARRPHPLNPSNTLPPDRSYVQRV
ncbi:hypothetical protein [Streptomyces sp. ISL-94]|uniref:hypothetical protein n=1 Tax=Streptomyces sp. ISL-94 TaxID=2819190 RepID=UPI001BEA173C|nr:hypothetical protein [Streptomyces sp. ISL-94]MBT2477385.1 hypothetical protein [Streptomyces sp. ISL-94]